jgi:lipid A 4'-phosphatase
VKGILCRFRPAEGAGVLPDAGVAVPTSSDRLIRSWLLATVLALAVFAAAPGLDLVVTRQFFSGGAFLVTEHGTGEWLRQLLWTLSIAMMLVAAVGIVIAHATGRRALWVPGRVWVFVLLLYSIGPGLIVNGLLKAHWGRARPTAIVEFGGSKAFTAPLWPADQCARNCSFVGGEASTAMALAISICVIALWLQDRPGATVLRRVFAVAVAVAVTGGLLRLAAGRHFLSDTVFSMLIVAGVALALDRLVLRRPAPQDPLLTPPPIPPMSPATRRGSSRVVALD